MMQQINYGPLPCNRRGFGLLELAIVMTIIVLLMVIIVNGAHLIDRARFQATVREMGSIAQASIDYYNSHLQEPLGSRWPDSLDSLSPVYMPQKIEMSSTFKEAYQLSFSNNSVTVTTNIPKGILVDDTQGSFLNIVHGASSDQISITQEVHHGLEM